MTSLKRLNGDRYLQIPIIPDETARVPKTKLESLNNLNKGFTSVGKSPRTVEYSDQYRQTRKKSANYLRELFQKKGSSKWLDDESDLGIDIKEVREQIMALDKDTAVGPDEITVSFLQATLSWSSTILYAILRRSLRFASAPELFRQSDICPIHKGDGAPTSTYKGYRPIALTSVAARVVESVIAKKLRQYLEENSLLRETQFGARAGRNTPDALTYFFTNIERIVKTRGLAHTVFLDISKAFDRVNHLALCEKLRLLGVSEIIIAWIFCFLDDRRQRVRVGGDVSDWEDVNIGIPQGTCLGPILFLVFINDCPLENDAIKSLNIALQMSQSKDNLEEGSIFVDDISIWSDKAPSDQKVDIEGKLDRILSQKDNTYDFWRSDQIIEIINGRHGFGDGVNF